MNAVPSSPQHAPGTYRQIELAVREGIATLTFARPEKRNAMSDDMRGEFIHALERISADRDIRALVLTGAGKAFCAGGDIAGMERRISAPAGEIGFNGWRRQQRVHYAQSLLHKMPKPVIAAVNGAATGLGADTALACDFVVAGEAASFSWSYIHRGIIPDGGGMYFLPRRVGLPKAKELIFTGCTTNAQQALELGIVDRLTTQERLLDESIAWAAELSKGSATALALGKSIIDQSYELSADDIFARGSQAQGICYTSTEHREAVLAFLSTRGEASRKG